MPRKKTTAEATPVVNMDFNTTAIRNPVVGHSSAIDVKAQEWGGFHSDVLSYLTDINVLSQFADMANNANELAERLDPFLDNAKTAFEAMQKLADGQVTWTELRKKYGTHVANAIAKIRNTNAEFEKEMQVVDASDRANMARIEQKRQHALTEVAAQLSQDLQAEMWRHQQKISGIENRHAVQQERQQVATGLREQRQALLNRARYGSKSLGDKTAQEVIPVNIQQTPVASTVSATGEQRGNWGSNLKNLWNKLGDR